MGLLTPGVPHRLCALAVPLLVHLIRRERHDAVEFPSLMFISRIPQRTVKRRRIRNWWLFALRSLALILLVGAFARPFVERPADVAAAGAARDVVILLDRSYSMGYGDRWERALAAAREAVDGLGPNDRGALVLFDAGARTAVQATADRTRLRAALETATVGAGVTRYTPALKLAQSALARRSCRGGRWSSSRTSSAAAGTARRARSCRRARCCGVVIGGETWPTCWSRA
jgi:hypothetical protein